MYFSDTHFCEGHKFLLHNIGVVLAKTCERPHHLLNKFYRAQFDLKGKATMYEKNRTM